MWNWLLLNPRGQLTRIACGSGILLIAALVDFAKRGRAATRWREYAFLLFCVVVAMLYGIANDQITSRISWEYYAYGKGLAPVLGNKIPPASGRLSWEAAKVGMQATWAVGLLIGVAMLLANNPRKSIRRLTYSQLVSRLPWVFCGAMVAAVLLGTIGYHGGFVRFSRDFQEMVQRDEFRPRRFMAVYGVHLGGYIGGALGTIALVVSIARSRNRFPFFIQS